MDVHRVLTDREALADFIRRAEEAAKANLEAADRMRVTLAELSGGAEYTCTAAAVQPGDLLDRWDEGVWWPVVSSEKCTLDDCWRIGFSDGDGLHAAPDDEFKVRRNWPEDCWPVRVEGSREGTPAA